MSDRLLTEQESELVLCARLVLRDVAQRLKGRHDVTTAEGREIITALIQVTIGNEAVEHAMLCSFDNGGRLIETVTFPAGKPGEIEIPIRELAKHILDVGASACLLAHNHPSGTCQPSREDEKFTDTLASWLAIIDCSLIDHLVVTADEVHGICGRWTK